MTSFSTLPANLIAIRAAAMRAIAPIKPADSTTRASPKFLFLAKRTVAGNQLPPYYLVYFLLVDLLGFEKVGKLEKVAWSIPIDFNGQAFVVEHRKLGVGVFVENPDRDEQAARQIVQRIQKAVKSARPFFHWLADQAADSSAINVLNNNNELYQRYRYLRDLHRTKAEEAERRKDERIVVQSGNSRTTTFPGFQLLDESRWVAHSAIEAFFSWTEHVLIHLTILRRKLASAREIARLANSDWPEKFKAAFEITQPAAKEIFDRLLLIRSELRNYVAHGAFGKHGEAFQFHSGAGAVPLLLPHAAAKRKFRFESGLAFNSVAALGVLDEFETFLWDGDRAPAKIYIESELPFILTMVADGSYTAAMRSEESMQKLATELSHRFDQSANMDW